ncbi:MAG TPA: DNA methyltransferase [Candidatus Elarobacter sp.]|jgi:hypothetical protein|nr:DNA methyltransferase [Candidatus Elarobacter sp.]
MIAIQDNTAFQGFDEAAWDEDAESIHRWYRIIMGFDWNLVQYILDILNVGPGDTVLDPFCGSGTTLVQCKKRGVKAVGLDVNPACLLASKVKTNWQLNSDDLSAALSRIHQTLSRNPEAAIDSDNALEYLRSSGMIERGWLSLYKARRVLLIKDVITQLVAKPEVREFFLLALMSALVTRIADIKFGPELYCLPRPRRYPVLKSFIDSAQAMIDDLRHVPERMKETPSLVAACDSRSTARMRSALQGDVDYVITSPPYPNEHDYTRSTRLELVMLDHVQDLKGLRSIKQQMVRCTTKGIYKGDSDADECADVAAVEAIAQALDRRARGYSDGFSRLYGRMVREYFGGMACHLRAILEVLRNGGRCAYVVRDSQSLLGVYIDTPGILADIAVKCGFILDDIIEWKRVRGSTGKRTLIEKVIVLTKPL